MAAAGDPRETSVVQDIVVNLDFEKAISVAAFLAERGRKPGTGPLSLAEREALVDQAILLVDELYVHLPVKKVLYAVDPVQRLRLLKARLARDFGGADDLPFHREMVETFTSVRDLHTMYILPKPFNLAVALVPFQIESYVERGERKYIATNVITGLTWFKPAADFGLGAEVVRWNGIPIARAVELIGERNSGSNPDARLARGLARLTIRPLARALPPEEEAVTLEYRPSRGSSDGKTRTVTVPWRVVEFPNAAQLPPDGSVLREMAEAIDYESDTIREVKRQLYAPSNRAGWTWHPMPKPFPENFVEKIPVTAAFAQSIDANRFKATGQIKDYGYIRIRTFSVKDRTQADEFVAEFDRLLQAMPTSGVILDIRDNPGGTISAAERLLQYLTPRAIEPECGAFIASPLSSLLGRERYPQWSDSIQSALETGAQYSLANPLTPPTDANHKGQCYYGPVVLITSALSYSSADIFAAGFQDHEIGTVIGVDRTTGGGGADVMTQSDLYNLVATALRDLEGGGPNGRNPFRKLSRGDFHVAFRRMLRVGARAGVLLEDLGVTSNLQYSLTKDDLLSHNVDLINRAVEELAKAKCGLLRVKSVRRDGRFLRVDIETDNLVRIDIAVDGWRSQSVRVPGGPTTITADLPPGSTGTSLELNGYDGCERDSRLLATRRVDETEWDKFEPAPKSAPAKAVRRRVRRRNVWGRARARA